jgi:hypothetical protein
MFQLLILLELLTKFSQLPKKPTVALYLHPFPPSPFLYYVTIFSKKFSVVKNTLCSFTSPLTSPSIHWTSHLVTLSSHFFRFQRESSFTVPPFAVPFSVMRLIIHQFFSHIITAKTQYRKFETKIPRKGTAQPPSKFLYSCFCERFIYSHDWFAYSAAGK